LNTENTTNWKISHGIVLRRHTKSLRNLILAYKVNIFNI